MDRFEALTVFVAVAEERGFAKAARRLGISPPAATRAVAALEQHLGVALLHRSTRSVTLTEDGIALLDRARDVLTQLRDAEHHVMGRRSSPLGEFHITAPVTFGRLHVLPVAIDLLRRFRDMSVRLMLLDRNIRIVEEGIDVAVRIGPLTDSSLIAVPIGAVRQTIVASPAYCKQRGVPLSPEDIVHHDTIAGDSVRVTGRWQFGQKLERSVAVDPRMTVNSVDAVIAAAEAGLGLANLFSYQVAEGLAAGRLRAVLEEHALPPVPVNLLFHPNRARMPAVRLFIDGMRKDAGAWRCPPENP